jgi:hypothetical protein
VVLAFFMRPDIVVAEKSGVSSVVGTAA